MEDFWNYIFGSEEGGVVRVALRSRDKKFQQTAIKWPEEKERLLTAPKVRDKGDLYFSPALFKPGSTTFTKADVLGSRVAWVDLDKPTAVPDLQPEPGLVVASGTGQHLYWAEGSFKSELEIEAYNLYLMELYGGDPTGWDANQLLRIPETFNWKTGHPRPVEIIKFNPTGKFLLPEHRLFREILGTDSGFKPVSLIEALQQPLTPYIKRLLEKQPNEIFDRSTALFHLAMCLVEEGFEPETVFPLVHHADSVWGKFAGRDDKELRIAEIVTRASARSIKVEGFPDAALVASGTSNDNEDDLYNERPRPVGWRSLGQKAKPIKWIVEGVIRERGLVLTYGATGIGKSTVAMNMAALVATGSSHWLGWKVINPDQKILYSSLEMDADEIKYFLDLMSGQFSNSAAMLDRLEERVHFLPVGMAVPINSREGQKYYEKHLSTGQYTGFVLDTLASSVEGSLSDEKAMREIANWIDKVRKKYGVWVFVLHHPRKEPSNVRNRKTSLLDDGTDDSFGSRIIGDRANTVLKLFRGKEVGYLELVSAKTRMAAQNNNALLLRRNGQLFYELISSRKNEDTKQPVEVESFPDEALDKDADRDGLDGHV